MKKPKIKLIFFDIDGTIFHNELKDSYGNTAPSAWTVIAKHLGKEALKEEEATKVKWTNKEYRGYVEWMEDTIRIHKKYGLRKDFFEKVINSLRYFNGVKETFEEINKRKIKTAIISGSFKALSDRAQKDLKIPHSFTAGEYFWGKDGEIIGWNLLPSDYEGKIVFMKLIMEEHGLKPEECAFVGDGRNDIPLAKAVGLSIAFNGAKELQAVCTYSINQEEGKEDFREVLKYLS